MKKSKFSPIALAILSLLAEEPMHPYRMQQLLKERGKDDVINVKQRASIYQTIDRLVRDGLIKILETTRGSGRPDRTIYESTEEGRNILRHWLRTMLSSLTKEYPDFPVAVSFMSLLTLEEVLEQLEIRESALEQEWRHADTDLRTYKDMIPRLFMLELEYKRAVLFAELEWVHSIIDDIRTGSLVWNEEWLKEIALRLNSQPLD